MAPAMGDPQRHVLLLLLAGILLAGASRHKHSHRVPIIDLNGAEELIGTIREDERTVAVSPHLHIVANTGPVCRYELTAWDDGAGADKPLPLVGEVLDKAEGSVLIRLRDGAAVDCADGELRVRLAAVRCGDDAAKSEPVLLKVRVQDTNNNAPLFDAPWYSFDVEEGRVAEVARLVATDKDCGHPYGRVCRYEITNALEENPFRIDDQGVLSTARPLNRSHSDSHILTVVAYDCAMLRSKSTLVTVHVLPQCVDGVQEAPPVEYRAGSGDRPLLPRASVAVCPRERKCTVKSAKAKLVLEAPARREQLDRDALDYCGVNKDTQELLPLAQRYNGTAVTVAASALIPERFTLAFDMQRAGGNTAQKESVLCEADDFGMNRHHFAVYVRHCKLELLLRREAEGAEADFRSAEWRWSAPEVCDGGWHSYAIAFADLDNVTLLVDGERFDASERNPEILDDWPLHQAPVHATRLVVGACWHGRSQAMVQPLRGNLSSLLLLRGAVEAHAPLLCLHRRHHERLRLAAVQHMASGQAATLSADQTQLALTADSLEQLTQLLRGVQYAAEQSGAALLPAGRRSVAVSSQVWCAESDRALPLGIRRVDIDLKRAGSPHLFISGRNLISSHRRAVKAGSVMLPDVQITVTQRAADGTNQQDATAQYKLDWCKVHLKPARDMDLEYFSSPAALMASLKVDFEHDKQGIVLKGEESVAGYAQVLAQIHYFNTRPDSYNKRMYTLQCAMLGGRVVSNMFVVTMAIEAEPLEAAVGVLSELPLHFKPLSTAAPAAVDMEDGELEKHFEASFDQLGSNRLQNILEMDLPRPKALLSHHGYDGGQGAVAGGAVAIVVVICVGFLLVLLVMGVLKMRDAPLPRRRNSRKMTADGMEWDNEDGINITVNPLEEIEKANNRMQIYSEEEGDDEEQDDGSSEDGESFHGDLTEDDSDNEESRVLPLAENGRLEWDDSTLASGAPRTYHV